jgi:hypothetical protein
VALTHSCSDQIDELIYEADRGSGQVAYQQFVDMLFMYDN